MFWKDKKISDLYDKYYEKKTLKIDDIILFVSASENTLYSEIYLFSNGWYMSNI